MKAIFARHCGVTWLRSGTILWFALVGADAGTRPGLLLSTASAQDVVVGNDADPNPARCSSSAPEGGPAFDQDNNATVVGEPSRWLEPRSRRLRRPSSRALSRVILSDARWLAGQGRIEAALILARRAAMLEAQTALHPNELRHEANALVAELETLQAAPATPFPARPAIVKAAPVGQRVR